MRRECWLVFALLLLAPMSWAQGGRFQVGQRIVQPSTGETGTVMEINAAQHQVWIHFDSRPAGDAGSWFLAHVGTKNERRRE
jgi:hypothetical protein